MVVVAAFAGGVWWLARALRASAARPYGDCGCVVLIAEAGRTLFSVGVSGADPLVAH